MEKEVYLEPSGSRDGDLSCFLFSFSVFFSFASFISLVILFRVTTYN